VRDRDRGQHLVLGIGLVVGFLLACAKLSAPRWVKIPVELYIWFFAACR
jgi:ABC-type amino acid transport system permease subunit